MSDYTNPEIERFRAIQARYKDLNDPLALFAAQIEETIRTYAVDLGVCPDCLSKFPDPLDKRGSASAAS